MAEQLLEKDRQRELLAAEVMENSRHENLFSVSFFF
jgi:hypothetical protein